MLPFEEIPAFAAVVCLGIFAQASTGFAAGLVIMPLMLWAGQGIPEAQAALIVSTLPQNLLGVIQYRHTLEVKEMLLPAGLRLLALPIGMAVLFLVDEFPVDYVRQIIGAVVILCVSLLLIFRPQPRRHLHVGWTWIAFLTSGFFQGCTGTGGPMMVLWVQAHDWSTKRTRAFLFLMYLISILPAWCILFYLFDQRIVSASLTSVAMFPLLLVATWAGLRVGTWLGRQRLRRVTMALLLLIGFVGVFSPMFNADASIEDASQQSDKAVEDIKSLRVAITTNRS